MMEWPYKNRPGVPLCPEQDGWHWVKARSDNLKPTWREKFPAQWTAGNRHWIHGTYAPEYAAENWIYLGSCLPPDEAEGLRARVAVVEEALKECIPAMDLAIEHRMIPISSVADGGANRHSQAAHIADQFREALRTAKEALLSIGKATPERPTTTDEAFAAALRSIEEKRLVDEYAIKLAGGLTKWHLLPSFKDHFTNGKSHEELRDRARKLLLSMRPADKDLREPACVERWPECESGLYDPRCCRYPKACSCDSAAIFAAFQEANNAEAKP